MYILYILCMSNTYTGYVYIICVDYVHNMWILSMMHNIYHMNMCIIYIQYVYIYIYIHIYVIYICISTTYMYIIYHYIFLYIHILSHHIPIKWFVLIPPLMVVFYMFNPSVPLSTIFSTTFSCKIMPPLLMLFKQSYHCILMNPHKSSWCYAVLHWSNMAGESSPSMIFPAITSIYFRDFPAMFDCQRVSVLSRFLVIPFHPIFKHLKAPFNHHSTTIQPPFNHHSTTIQQPFNHHSTTIQPPFNHHSTTIQPPFNLHSTTIQPPFNHHSTTIQPPFNHHSTP